jgi:hypothetical protein
MRRQLLSLSVLLAVAGVSSVASAALLSVDFNDRTGGAGSTPSNTQAGFSAWKMSGTTAASSALETQAVGAYTVTLQAFDDHQDENTTTTGIQDGTGQIDDRLRTTPTNSGAFTFADLYDDVIFAGLTTGPTGGMDLTVSSGALLPNTQYVVSIYAFDSGSSPAPQPRAANWLDGNNSNALVTATSFGGATLPTSNDQYKFSGLAQTDASGVLFLKGRNTTPNGSNGADTIGVFINGLEINEVPEPASLALFLVAATLLQLRRQHR